MATIADMTAAAHEALASKNQPVTLESTVSPPETAVEPAAPSAFRDYTVDLSPSLSDTVAERTKEVSASLVAKLKESRIPVANEVSFAIDGSGQVTATNANRASTEKIERFFADNSDIAQELKEVAALNTLVAQQEVEAMYEKEKREAEAISDPDERKEALKKAEIRRLTRMATTSERSAALTLQKSALSSAALEFIRAQSSL